MKTVLWRGVLLPLLMTTLGLRRMRSICGNCLLSPACFRPTFPLISMSFKNRTAVEQLPIALPAAR